MRILLGMSGGIDSTFAAKKLVDEGHHVEGAVLKMHEYTELSAARSAAENVSVRLHEIDCTVEFANTVKADFVHQYTKGRTPNPCVLCNEKVKFRYLYEYAMEHGFDAIATGHYARIVKLVCDGELRYALSVAEDIKKDQTYMLYRLPQEILSVLCLPLAESEKESVRDAARKSDIHAADRKDSQEICFLPDGSHTEFIESVAGKSPVGDFIDEGGRILGKHNGIIRYTVGQRKGLGIALGERMFVTRINPEDNTVTLAPHLSGRREVRVCDMVYSGMPRPKADTVVPLSVKLRYTAVPIPAVAHLYADGGALLEFSESVAAAPGQSAVLYRDNAVMCGGFIC